MERPRVAVLVDRDPPPNLDQIAALGEVRTARAADLPGAIAGADVLLAWDFLTPRWRTRGRRPTGCGGCTPPARVSTTCSPRRSRRARSR